MLSMLPSNEPWHIYIYVSTMSVQKTLEHVPVLFRCVHIIHSAGRRTIEICIMYKKKWLGNLEETCVELYCQSLTRVAID